MSSETRVVGKTLSYEETLPSLPVPSLKQTCMKYLESGICFISSFYYLLNNQIIVFS